MEIQIIDARLHLENTDACIRIFGRKVDGQSITLDVTGEKMWYFFTDMWSDGDSEFVDTKWPYKKERDFQYQCADEPCRRSQVSIEEPAVVEWREIRGKSLMGYSAEEKTMAQVFVCRPWLMKTVPGFFHRDPRTFYESKISPVDRFMVDHDLVGCGWMELDQSVEPSPMSMVRTDLYAKIDKSQFVARPDINTNAPLVCLSFDIECLGLVAKEHPCIQISTDLWTLGNDEQREGKVFMIGECGAVEGFEPRTYVHEKDMLMGFFAYVREKGVDVLIGYNSNSFDLPFLIQRARLLGAGTAFAKDLSQVGYTTRMGSSNQAGAREVFTYHMPGVIPLDLLEMFLKSEKLRSYKLDNVAEIFLGTKKEEMDYKEIPILQNGSDDDRARLAQYCFKDSWLCTELTKTRKVLINAIEMSRAVGTPLIDVMQRGQSHRITRKLLEKLCAQKPRKFFIPTLPQVKDENGEKWPLNEFVTSMPLQLAGKGSKGFQGATVLEPVKGFYEGPVAVFDFKSLYPSIMQAFNLSFDTLMHEKNDAIAHTESPNKFCFVKSSVHKGILVEVLDDLLNQRALAKKQMKAAHSEDERALYDGKQLAYKVICNSVYGFCGALRGTLPCLPISAAVTSFGRKMIDDTAAHMTTTYNAHVLYGDTDSVFVRFSDFKGTSSEFVKFCLDIEKEIQSIYTEPNYLEYEKFYLNFLLLKKKKYVGHKFEGGSEKGKLDGKGIEIARRDNATFLLKTMQQFLHHLCIESNVDCACQYLKSQVARLTSGQVPIEDLIMSKKYAKSSYATSTLPVHINLNNKIAKRSPELAYSVGDRIPYVIVSGKEMQSLRGEDPKYAQDHNIPLDLTYYLDVMLKQPMGRLLEPIIGKDRFRNLMHVSQVGPMDAFMERTGTKRQKEEYKAVVPSKKKKQTDMRSFMR